MCVQTSFLQERSCDDEHGFLLVTSWTELSGWMWNMYSIFVVDLV